MNAPSPPLFEWIDVSVKFCIDVKHDVLAFIRVSSPNFGVKFGLLPSTPIKPAV